MWPDETIFSRAQDIKKKKKKKNLLFQSVSSRATWTIWKTSFRIIAKPRVSGEGLPTSTQDRKGLKWSVRDAEGSRAALSISQPSSQPASRVNGRPKCRAAVRACACGAYVSARRRRRRRDARVHARVSRAAAWQVGSRRRRRRRRICPRFFPTAEQPAV